MKEWLLAKSNIRKTRSLTIGIIVLTVLAAMFANIMLIIFMDFQKNADREAKRLNSEDAYILIKGDISKIDDAYIKSLINDDVLDYEVTKNIGLASDLKYGEGTVDPTVLINKKDDILSNKIGKTEIVEEDESITGSYIYLPNQFNTGGGIKIGDEYKLDKYNYKVKGFFNNITYGSHNCGTIKVIVDDESYEKLNDEIQVPWRFIEIRFDLKDNVDYTKCINVIAKKINEDNINYNIITRCFTVDDAIYSRTFIAVVLGVSFLVMSMIIMLIVLFMISNSISNFIKENAKIIGAIKSLGYTSKNIVSSFLMQFGFISIFGSIIGTAISYVLLPLVLNFMTSQIGIPYEIKFIPICSILPVIGLYIITLINTCLFTKKAKKIEPITALRQGISTHNFKKNRIKLEKTKLPINMGLAIKTMITNAKQNIVTSIVVFLLIFAGTVSLDLYQNFSVKPKASLFSFEICNGAVLVENDENKEVYNYLENYEGVYNTRLILNTFIENNDMQLFCYVLEDCDKLNNKDVCYDGRLPKYDNEIAISGKYCKKYGYNIGDEIEITKSGLNKKYIVSGYIQTTNNNGLEAVMKYDGLKKLQNTDQGYYYYFDTEENVDVNKCLEDVKAQFENKITTVVNFDDAMKGVLSTFKSISNIMVAVIIVISGLVIFLVLYLLIKTLIIRKKKDYGILKAVGYTSGNIVFQNAVSFMPSIILSTIISCIISCIVVNPYIGLIMSMCGVMKVTFELPINLIVLFGIGFVILSFTFAVLLSRKTRKIEPYKLISED